VFFLEFRKRLGKQFAYLFGDGDAEESGTNDFSERTQFSKQWGWYNISPKPRTILIHSLWCFDKSFNSFSFTVTKLV